MSNYSKIKFPGELEFDSRHVRFVQAIQKFEPCLAYEFEVKNVDVCDLRRVFGYNSEDPFFAHCYDIKPQHSDLLEHKTGRKLDHGQYEYVLAAYQVPENENSK